MPTTRQTLLSPMSDSKIITGRRRISQEVEPVRQMTGRVVIVERWHYRHSCPLQDQKPPKLRWCLPRPKGKDFSISLSQSTGPAKCRHSKIWVRTLKNGLSRKYPLRGYVRELGCFLVAIAGVNQALPRYSPGHLRRTHFFIGEGKSFLVTEHMWEF